jgi:hypothetical protein
MKINDFFYEEKTRLDPACWTDKKIGTPKTKVKGGIRVNNCVPAESVAEELSIKHQRDHSTQHYPDTSNSLATRSVSQAELPNVYKTADGHPTVRGRFHGKAAQTRVNPTITPTSVNRKDSSGPIPAFLKKGVAEAFPNPGSGSTGSSKEDKRIAAALRKKHIPTTPNDKKKGVAEGSLNELSSDLLKRSAQVATDKRNQAMDPELHNALGGGYMNPLATHYDNVSQKMDNRAAQVRKKETIQKIASKIASPAVMRKMGMSDMEEGVAEGSNGEYDDEAGMADNNLETLRRAVDGIDNVINTGDNLPEWCQEKIAVAKSMLVTVWDYMRSEEQIEDPEIAEMYEAMQLMAESMAHKHRVSVDLVWESFEALDDHMLYETAAWRRKEGKSAKGGLNAKGVASYRRENPGSKLQTAVTTKPSKLKPGSKAAKRRKSFCARMSGVKGPAKKPNGKPTRKTLALRKWNC